MEFCGLELFLDNQIVAYTHNMRRAVRQPDFHPQNPIVRRDHPWESKHVCIYGSVLYDEQRGRFRMWYNALGQDYYNQQVMAYAESDNGFEWTKPMLDLRAIGDHKKTNVVMGPECNLHGPCVIANPDSSDPDRRYLLLFDTYDKWRPEARSMGISGRWVYAAESPDGMHWSPDKGRPAFAGKADSGQSVVWDPQAKMFRAYVRLTSRDAFGQRIRIWRLLESEDFVHWQPPQELLRCDEQDGYPDMQIQQLTVTRYDGIYIGLLSLFPIVQYVSTSTDGGLNEGPQINEIQLITSRDGINFTRVADRALFMPHNDRGGFGTHGFRTASQMVSHNDKVHIYCDGRAGTWDDGGMEIGVATLPRDRFVAMTPQRLIEDGIVELVPLTYPHRPLRLNASTTAAGRVEIELADFEGTVIEGFDRDKSVTITGDELDHQIQWKSEGKTYGIEALPSRVQGQPVRLRFWTRQAHLYALRC